MSNLTLIKPCPYCGREWGERVYCQSRGQVDGLPEGVVMATLARRLGGFLLDSLLSSLTLGIGWLIWCVIVWGRGQTPAKQLLGMRCVHLVHSNSASWGRMALREFLLKLVLMSLLTVATLGLATLVLSFQLMWTKNRQQLWDLIADTIVVHDPNKRLTVG